MQIHKTTAVLRLMATGTLCDASIPKEIALTLPKTIIGRLVVCTSENFILLFPLGVWLGPKNVMSQ